MKGQHIHPPRCTATLSSHYSGLAKQVYQTMLKEKVFWNPIKVLRQLLTLRNSKCVLLSNTSHTKTSSDYNGSS